MISEFDHPDHGWKWTRLEVEFINKKLKEAYDKGYKHGAAGSTITDPAEIRRVFEIDEADYPHPDSGFAKL
jgi:hypothetical protein